MRPMLVRSSPLEWTFVTLPPWYQSQTIAKRYYVTKGQDDGTVTETESLLGL